MDWKKTKQTTEHRGAAEKAATIKVKMMNFTFENALSHRFL